MTNVHAKCLAGKAQNLTAYACFTMQRKILVSSRGEMKNGFMS